MLVAFFIVMSLLMIVLDTSLEVLANATRPEAPKPKHEA